MGSHWSDVKPLSNMTGIVIKRRNLDTDINVHREEIRKTHGEQ